MKGWHRLWRAGVVLNAETRRGGATRRRRPTHRPVAWERTRQDEYLGTAYREMALDTERERDALEWSEGLIGDIATGRPDAPR